MRRLVYASREPIIRSGAALTVTLGTRVADHIGGSARSYLTLSTLATVLQSQEDHPDHRLTMPLQRGSLFLRWERCPVRRRCAGDGSTRPGEEHL